MKTGLTLWELDERYVDLSRRIEENDGEMTPEMETEFDGIVNALIAKQDGYLAVHRNLDSLIEQADMWIKRLQARKRSFQNQQDRLKNGLLEHLIKTGQTEIVSDTGKVRLMQSQSVGQVDMEKVPKAFVEVIQEFRLRKRELLAALKQGPVEGAELDTKPYVRIF